MKAVPCASCIVTRMTFLAAAGGSVLADLPGMAFTDQGRFADGGSPASGAHAVGDRGNGLIAQVLSNREKK